MIRGRWNLKPSPGSGVACVRVPPQEQESRGDQFGAGLAELRDVATQKVAARVGVSTPDSPAPLIDFLAPLKDRHL